MAAPTADHFDALGQLGDVDVATAVVGVLDQNVVCAGGNGAFTGGLDLGGHLTAGSLIAGTADLGLIPGGGTGYAFDVCTDENSHGNSSYMHKNKAMTLWDGPTRSL